MRMKKPRRAAEQPRVKAPTSEVVLWRPSIVLASRIEAPARRKPVTLAAPTAHPDAGEPRIVGSIFSLADAGATLAAGAADARARALAPAPLFTEDETLAMLDGRAEMIDRRPRQTRPARVFDFDAARTRLRP